MQTLNCHNYAPFAHIEHSHLGIINTFSFFLVHSLKSTNSANCYRWQQQQYQRTSGINNLPFFVSQFATVEVSITFIKDEFGPKVLRYLKREELLTLAVCVVCFILGIPHMTRVHRSGIFYRLIATSNILPAVFPARSSSSLILSQGGIYIFQLMDHYTAVESLMVLASCEVIAVCWLFGKEKKNLVSAIQAWK